MKGEFLYTNGGFPKVFYRLNPNRIPENVSFQDVIRSSSHVDTLLVVF